MNYRGEGKVVNSVILMRFMGQISICSRSAADTEVVTTVMYLKEVRSCGLSI